MKQEKFHHSFLKKISTLFFLKKITSIIFINDEEGENIDNVLFFEINSKNVVGFYKNDINPFITREKINEIDSFNLYSTYKELYGIKKTIIPPFIVENIKLFFNSNYNEIIAIYLASKNFESSLFIIFSEDEIYLYINERKKPDEIIENNLMQFRNKEFLVLEKNTENKQNTIKEFL